MFSTFTYTASLTSGDPLPSFITFISNTLSFNLSSIDIDDAMTYGIIVKASLDDGN